MLKGLMQLPVGQRRLIFFLIIGGILLGLIALFLILSVAGFNTAPRTTAVPVMPRVTVSEFATLPDDDAYPPTVAVAADGTVYTGSFVSGAVWAIAADGSSIVELPGTRDGIGAVSAIAVIDNALLVVDALDADPRTNGSTIALVANGRVTLFIAAGEEPAFSALNDIALDEDGFVYVSDSGRNEVWRIAADGTNPILWWSPPAPENPANIANPPRRATVGLAYDRQNRAILVTDPQYDQIFSVPTDSGEETLIYSHGMRPTPPGFDGIDVLPDGTIVVAALGQNGVALLREDGLVYVAGNFRGAADVAVVSQEVLIVTNFDQASLVVPLLEPQRPFALDRVVLGTPDAE